MDIPFYNDIYEFPGGYVGEVYRRHRGKPHIEKSYIVEVEKTTDIVDVLGNLRYTAKLTSRELENGRGYKVKVYCFLQTPRNIQNDNGDEGDQTIDLVVKWPEVGYEMDYGKAKKQFDTCVQQYRALVKAECKDFRDVDIYAEKMGYHDNVKCCATCRWSMRCRKNECSNFKNPSLECHSPKTQAALYYIDDKPLFNNKHANRYHSAWQKLPWQTEVPQYGWMAVDDYVPNRFWPHVEPTGVCNNYEARGPHHGPCQAPGVTLHDIVNEVSEKTVEMVVDNEDLQQRVEAIASAAAQGVAVSAAVSAVHEIAESVIEQKTMEAVENNIDDIVDMLDGVKDGQVVFDGNN